MIVLWLLVFIGEIVFYEVWLHYDRNGESYMDYILREFDDYGWILYTWKFWRLFFRRHYITFPYLFFAWCQGEAPLPWDNCFEWEKLLAED